MLLGTKFERETAAPSAYVPRITVTEIAQNAINNQIDSHRLHSNQHSNADRLLIYSGVLVLCL